MDYIDSYDAYPEANSNTTLEQGNPDYTVQPTARAGIAATLDAEITKTYATSIDPSATNSRNPKVYKLPREYIPFYVVNLLNNEVIHLDLLPEEITEGNSASFETQNIRGRSSPYQGYSGSGPRTVGCNFTLHDDLCEYGLLNTVNKFKSLVYPDYNGILEAPNCMIRFGDMFHMKAILTNIDVSWKTPYRNGIYLVANIGLNFVEVVDIPFSYDEIRSHGGYL